MGTHRMFARGVTVATLLASVLGAFPASAAPSPSDLQIDAIADVWVANDRGFAGFQVHGGGLIQARLTSGGVGVAGRVVHFSSDGFAMCDGVTDTRGVAGCPRRDDVVGPGVALALATNRYQASFDGDEQFLASTATGGMIVFG